MPRDVKPPFIRECELYGAEVTLVDGLITDAGRVAAEQGKPARLVRRLDAQGAVPHRRQEDDGLRGRRADGMDAARLDHLPDRRRHGHGRHVEGLRGDVGARLDRSRQAPAHGDACRPPDCAPIITRVRRRRREVRSRGRTRHTIADGLRVPKAVGDFLVLRAVRESGGAAIAVDDADMVTGMKSSAGSKASARRPKAAPRSTPFACSSPNGRDQAPRHASSSSTPAAR